MSTGITTDTVLPAAAPTEPAEAVYSPTFGAEPTATEPVKPDAHVFAQAMDDVPNFERQPKARVEFVFPKPLNGVMTGHLDMRRPTINDRLINGALKGSDADRELALFANLTSTPIPELLKLDLVDYGRLQDAFRSFLGFHRPDQSD